MQKLHPNAVWLFFVQSILGIMFSFVFFIIFAGISMLDGDLAEFLAPFFFWVGIAVIAALIVSFIWSKLSYHFYRYELTDAGFRKESGVIWKRYVTIPYNRIQNVDIYRGILARMLGLSDLQIQTAGTGATMSSYGVSGGGSEGNLPGLSKEEAERLRDELITRARQNGPGQGL